MLGVTRPKSLFVNHHQLRPVSLRLHLINACAPEEIEAFDEEVSHCLYKPLRQVLEIKVSKKRR